VTAAVRARLLDLLAPVVGTTGHDLEDVAVSQAGRRSVVRVVVDKDGGVSLDDVAEVSRVVSEALDGLETSDPGLLSGSYVLEVSSPGVDRPLTEPRHWRRNVGRLVRASLADGSAVTGRLTEAGADGVVLEVDGSPRSLGHDQLVKGAVQIEFSRAGREDA
jgi:ribosome maturation factor RimP